MGFYGASSYRIILAGVVRQRVSANLGAGDRARLVEGKTAVSLGLRNSSSRLLEARIELRWLGPSYELYGLERRLVSVGTGDSSIEISLPLSEMRDSLLYRLQYDVYPGEKNYTGFVPVKDILNLVHIADYAFTLSVVTAGLPPRPGKPFDIRALTFHPLTGQPIAGVHVKSGSSAAISDKNGIALLRIQSDPTTMIWSSRLPCKLEFSTKRNGHPPAIERHSPHLHRQTALSARADNAREHPREWRRRVRSR